MEPCETEPLGAAPCGGTESQGALTERPVDPVRPAGDPAGKLLLSQSSIGHKFERYRTEFEVQEFTFEDWNDPNPTSEPFTWRERISDWCEDIANWLDQLANWVRGYDNKL